MPPYPSHVPDTLRGITVISPLLTIYFDTVPSNLRLFGEEPYPFCTTTTEFPAIYPSPEVTLKSTGVPLETLVVETHVPVPIYTVPVGPV